MIRIRRPATAQALDARTRAYLEEKSALARDFPPRDPRIGTAWGGFLGTRARDRVAAALDAYSHAKCAYCEQVAAKDIEHFWPKTEHPDRMFSWENFLRGCKNCNNAKRDRFPLDSRGRPVLLDPCQDEPLQHLIWGPLTGAMVANPDRPSRGQATIELFQLNQEPLREERRSKYMTVLYLLAHVCREDPVTPETRERLQDELRPHRPWLGIVRQLLTRPTDPDRPIVEMALARLPAIRDWAAEWL